MSSFILVTYTLLLQYAHPVFWSPINLLEKNLNTWLQLIALEFLYITEFFSSVIRKMQDLFLSIELVWFSCPWLCLFTSNSLFPFLLPTALLPSWLPASIGLSYIVFSHCSMRVLSLHHTPDTKHGLSFKASSLYKKGKKPLHFLKLWLCKS